MIFSNYLPPVSLICDYLREFSLGDDRECLFMILWRTASLRSAPHQQTPDPVYIVVDKLVHCTEIYLSLFLALA
jgi:hypothetical protein